MQPDFFGAASAFVLGFPDQALSLVREASDLATTLNHPLSLIIGELFRTLVQLCRVNRATRCRASSAPSAWQRKRASRAGCGPIFSTAGRLLPMVAPKQASRKHCWISMRLARPDRNCSVRSTPVCSPTCAGLPDGSTTVSASQARRWSLLPRWISHWGLAEAHRIRGELLLARGQAEAAVETCFETAIATARQQGARNWEPRAAI
jgi:hypothetical protein